MESQLQFGKQWLEQLLDIMGLAAQVTTEGFEKITIESDSHWLNIDTSSLNPEQRQHLIGIKGESIDAIQYLANTIINLNMDPEAQNSFVVELNGYRVQRNQELAAITQEATTKVRETSQEVEIPGLSSAERKQIHYLLQNVEDLTTESRGQEPHRKLVVKLRNSDS